MPSIEQGKAQQTTTKKIRMNPFHKQCERAEPTYGDGGRNPCSLESIPTARCPNIQELFLPTETNG